NMTDEAARIHMGAAHLRSVALDWWSSLSAAERPPTWDLFAAGLRARFQPLSQATLARRQLDVLKQGPIQGVQEYITAFRRLLTSLPDMHESDRVHAFVRGLRPAIAAQVLIQRAATLAKAIEVATFVGGLQLAGTAATGTSSMELDALSLNAL